MSNFIEKSVQEIFDESMANAFIRERIEPVEEVEETFRSTLASRMETDRQEKYEEEQRLIEIEEKKMYQQTCKETKLIEFFLKENSKSN